MHSLTSLRFFAAGVVLVHHLCQLLLPTSVLWKAASVGFVGVGFFYVLSGFVLTWTFRSTLPVKNFYGRRFARVYPLHLATALVAVVLLLSWGERIAPAPTVLNLLLLQSWVPSEQYGTSLNAVSWSLSCEAFFYLCFPVLVRLVSRASRLRLVAAMTVAAMLTTAATVVALCPADLAEQILYRNPLFRMGEFLIGILLATAIRRGHRPRIAVRAAIAGWVASYLLAAALPSALHHFGVSNFRVHEDLLILPATCLLIMSVAAADLAGHSPLGSKWLVRLGDASFALYMIHFMIIEEWVRTVGAPASATNGVGIAAALGFVAIVGSNAVYLWFERPSEEILRRKLGAPSAETRGRASA